HPAAAGAGTGGGVAEASVRALAKLTQVMPARLRRHVEALAAVTVPASWGSGGSAPLSAGTLTAVALACRDAERVRFGYTAGDGVRTDRYVEPHRLVPLGSRWYLVGYDLTRVDWRTFRLDRITGPPRGTGERFRPRTLPAADAATFVRERIGSARSGFEVEVLIDAPASRVRAALGRWASVEEVGGGSAGGKAGVGEGGVGEAGRCRVRMTAENLDWQLMVLGMTGADFQVVSPPELIDRLRDCARRFTAAASAAAS
ncbi:MAG: WYL domain-containing protein, partial [Nocardiopsaceae bacterium]|nr:WYL domain-containing protein [Nocardiopsaceae bacterium]